MKAIVYEKYGSPDVLQLQEVEKPLPKENEVLIKIHSASINSWDIGLLQGKPYLARLDGGFSGPKHKILGCDVAGYVEVVGKNVTKFKPGDEVFGDLSAGNWSCFAEYVCANKNELLLKPSNISFEEAAAVPQAGLLAYQGLNYHREIQPGEKILFNGAGGGVGTYGVQIAKLFDAEVTCVDKAVKLQTLSSLGADYVIDYEKEDFTKNGKTYDRIIDVITNRSFFKYKRLLNPNGIFGIVGGTTPRILQVALLGLLKSKFAKKDGKKLGLVIYKTNKGLDYLAELLESGKVKSIIDRSFPLEKTADAFRYFEEGNFKGKIVITVS